MLEWTDLKLHPNKYNKFDRENKISIKTVHFNVHIGNLYTELLL